MPLEVVGGSTDTTGTSPAPEIVREDELSSVLPIGLLSDDDEDEEETLSVVELPLETSPSDTDLSTLFPLGLSFLLMMKITKKKRGVHHNLLHLPVVCLLTMPHLPSLTLTKMLSLP